MSRTCLRELDNLEDVLANTCYSVDKDRCDGQGKVTIDLSTDGHLLQTPLCVNHLTMCASVELKEEQHQNVNASLLKKVTLTDLHMESLVLRPDHFSVQHFKPRTWNKACDYLILTVFNKTKYALFVDLKTSLECAPDSHGRLVFQGLSYHSGMVWQMMGADALFDGLVNVVHKTSHKLKRAKSHVSELRLCGNTSLAAYRRRYLVLYQTVKCNSNTTGGGASTTQFVVPNDACLEQEVKTLEVCNNEKKCIGDLIVAAGV